MQSRSQLRLDRSAGARGVSVDRVLPRVQLRVGLQGPWDRSTAAASVVFPMDQTTPGVRLPIDVLIADDHSVVRDGIRTVLEREDGEFRVVGEAADVPSTITAVRDLRPDLLTLDLTMPGGSSLAALPACFMAHPSLAVAVPPMRGGPHDARPGFRPRARPHVRK